MRLDDNRPQRLELFNQSGSGVDAPGDRRGSLKRWFIMKRHLSTLVATAILTGATFANAADVTRIVMPSSEDAKVGFRFAPEFNFSHQTGQVARESHCQAGVTVGADGRQRCSEDSIVLNRELDWKQTSNFLDLDFRVGIARRVELGITVPIALSYLTDYSYAEDISELNSTIDRTSGAAALDRGNGDGIYSTYHYFEVSDGYDGIKRGGLGDIEFHLNFLALSQELNPNFANLLLGLTYQAPTGKARAGDNKGIGRGVHELTLRLAASRQIKFVEPYFSAEYTATMGNGGLFENLGSTQHYSRPGHQIDFRGGLEFELYKDESKGTDIRLGLGVIAGVRTPGRDYSPIFEGLANSRCNGSTMSGTGVSPTGAPYNPAASETNSECAWVVQQPGNTAGSLTDSSAPYAHNGITFVDRHLYIGGEAQLHMQFQRNIGIQIGLGYRAITNHLITGENTGEDHNGDRSVDMNPTAGERNPHYNPTLDATGHRFLIEGFRRLDVDAGLIVQF